MIIKEFLTDVRVIIESKNQKKYKVVPSSVIGESNNLHFSLDFFLITSLV